jgi:hypothetical protein
VSTRWTKPACRSAPSIASTSRRASIAPSSSIPTSASTAGPECPVSAIFPEDSVPADQVKYTEVNALWFKDRDAARAKINEWNPV